ncbi:MAG: PorP/SprF family type IX secretion system membrane protein [Crocinitomix sp.]|nr:PorP/SprF family type IX secretion system membrane protein [Crocinitomix sp.]
MAIFVAAVGGVYFTENSIESGDYSSNIKENGVRIDQIAQQNNASTYRQKGQNQVYSTSLVGSQTNSSTRSNNGVLNVSNSVGINRVENLAATNQNEVDNQEQNGSLILTSSTDKRNKAKQQEQDKLLQNNYLSEYVANPGISDYKIDLSKKSNVSPSSFANKTKRVYRKVEKMFGYPVGLINLRDPQMLLPENDLLSFNPAFAGGMLASRVEFKHRNQWLGSNYSSQTTQMSIDGYVPELRGGVGMIVNSKIYNGNGVADYSVDLVYSPKIKISNKVILEAGVKVTLGMMTGNTYNLKGAKIYELERGLPIALDYEVPTTFYDRLWYKDIALGFVLNTESFYFGLSADNLNRHYATGYREEGKIEPMKSPVLFNGILGTDIESSNKKMVFSPFVSARKFGEQTEAWAGLNFKINRFTLGGSYSTNHDFTAVMGMKFKKFKCFYQLDRTTSTIATSQLYSHNIGIRFNSEFKSARFN